jgi:hypothetical protein
MTNAIIDVLDWVGSLLLVVAYYQNSRNIIGAKSFSYQFMNVSGSVFLIINTVFYGAYPSSAVNIIWVFIGTYYLINNSKK